MRFLVEIALVTAALAALAIIWATQGQKCEPSYTLRGVPFAIQIRECVPSE